MSDRIVILGAGESGVGSAILAQKKGFDVWVSDLGPIKPGYKEVLSNYAIPFEEGKHTDQEILKAVEVIKSPGIPEEAPMVKKLHERGIPVISEIEFAGRYSKAKTVCITGSNGKTTTTMLAYHLLKNAGLHVGLAGNVGQSFARQVAEKDFDYYVIELSSFQLDGMYEFRADVAVLLNITPDHLDRYGYKFQNYVDSKFRIIQNQTGADFFIYWSEDPVIQEELKKRTVAATCLPFAYTKAPENGAGIDNDRLTINWNKNTFSMSIFDIALQGKHNAYNSMAAGLAGKVLNIRNEKIRESLSDFRGVEHRLERFLKVHGIEFINDSKATNVNSTWYALESINRPIVWIVGGVDKGNSYKELEPLVREKVKAIVCLGTDNKKIVDFFTGIVPDIIETQDIKDAVRASYYLAKDGEVVLLSPACASFDLFENYEDRGRQFKMAVREL
jgi:UDP-N-acetylmuramoylalanine--D-glutamate ligase